MKNIVAYTLILFAFIACNSNNEKKAIVVEEVSLSGVNQSKYPTLLSEWNLFEAPMAQLKPIAGIIPYDLNTPLFSDYAHKARFVKLPEGLSASYHPTEVMDFPVGTILIKNFYYEIDESIENGERQIIETRLLVHEEDEWKAMTYAWNEAQTEATLEIAGKSIPVTWKDKSGVVNQVKYSVPNQVQCKSCHELNGKQMPIGPTARQLNKQFNYESGHENQLIKWTNLDLLNNTPEKDEIPSVPVWNDPNSGTLKARARAWLEINCAHCHRDEGPAKNSGLSLRFSETDLYKLGIGKPPVAAGRGSGGLKYGIVPGDPESSILFHRIQSTDPGVMMPEVGRKLNHDEGIALIREWIENMESAPGS